MPLSSFNLIQAPYTACCSTCTVDAQAPWKSLRGKEADPTAPAVRDCGRAGDPSGDRPAGGFRVWGVGFRVEAWDFWILGSTFVSDESVGCSFPTFPQTIVSFSGTVPVQCCSGSQAISL